MSVEFINFKSADQDLGSSSGFTQGQFKKLDGLFCIAAAHKALFDRAVDCDMEEGIARFTYYQSKGAPPYLQFTIRRVGPRNMMFELYKEGKGRIAKSGLFERAYERLENEINALLPDQD